MEPSYDAGNVLVPSQGWVIYEGQGNILTRAQQLRSLDGKWENGPYLYQNNQNEGHCMVQVGFILFS